MSKSTAEIRQAFLDFFHGKGHQIVESSSLVPHNDPTLLFTNAGMNQFKDVFLGLDKRTYKRATTAQRCVRAGGKHNDLENVGYTARHHTFFEMLGNFSFGDYFKHDAIHYAWELLTSKTWFNLPKEKLWVTVYATDDEAYNIWANDIGVPHERIIRIGDNKGAPYASDNFWQMGDTGPCGPCTEIFYDHGEHIWGGPPGSSEEDGDRYIEIWNIVFMQFNRQSDGALQPLPHPSVDTGMGLERITAVLQHVNSNYEIDLFQTLIRAVAKLTGTQDLSSKSLRVVADHIRSCAFLIADGVIPSNENRGYVLRRIIRRAVRHGHMLGAQETFFYKLVAPLIEVMGDAANELKRQQIHVEHILKNEEEQFSRTLERGLTLLDEALGNLQGNVLGGETAFRLYDTYGFPLDLTADVCRERNITVDEAGFDLAMEQQRRRARESSGFTTDYNNVIRLDDTTEFVGYASTQQQTIISALFVNELPVNEIKLEDKAIIILESTPFYAESGGQVGDKGIIVAENAVFMVKDAQKYGGAIGHIGQLEEGVLKVGDKVNAVIDLEHRTKVRLNHTATHLLHAALRSVLGGHVTQKGSLVSDGGLRFDFSHPEAMKPEQIRAVEQIVNQQIRNNIVINTEVMPIDQAKAKGAMALFGEKYDDEVRVLTIDDFSIELCGGTHVSSTGEIGLFCIISESGIAAGVRRIEAVTGQQALESVYQNTNLLQEIAALVKGDVHNLAEKVRQTVERTKQLEKTLQQLKEKVVIQESNALAEHAKEVNGVKLLVSQVDVEPKMLRTMVDEMRNRINSGIIVLATVDNTNKVSVIVGVTKDLTNRFKANELVSIVAERLGGKGGGRPDMAQAGGDDVSALSSALALVQAWVNTK